MQIPQLPGNGSRKTVGLHFSPSSVALFVLSKDGVNLSGCVARPCDRSIGIEVLADLTTKHGVKGKPAYVTLGRSDYDTQYVDLPGIDDAELREALQWRVTPPAGANAGDVVATGMRLSQDRLDDTDGTPLVRATVMSRQTLDWIADAVFEAGLDLRAIYPQETSLIALAQRNVTEDIPAGGPGPPILSVFVTPQNTDIAITRGDQLYLSRTLQMEVAPDTGLTPEQQNRLIRECLRTAENFNVRLSSVRLTDACIGPSFTGIEAVRHALTGALGIECRSWGLPPDIQPADDATAATATTPEGLLAIAGTLDLSLPDNASIYQRPSRVLSYSSPEVLGAAFAAGVVGLATISGVQGWINASTAAEAEALRAEGQALQTEVRELRASIDATENADPDPALVETRQALEEQRDYYATLLDTFADVDTSLINGFSAPLRALGQTSDDRLWLQSVNIQPNSVTFRGQALDLQQPDAMAARLQQTAPFSGWTPNRVSTGSPDERGNGLTVRSFTINSSGLLTAAPPDEGGEAESFIDGAELQQLMRQVNDESG